MEGNRGDSSGLNAPQDIRFSSSFSRALALLFSLWIKKRREIEQKDLHFAVH